MLNYPDREIVCGIRNILNTRVRGRVYSVIFNRYFARVGSIHFRRGGDAHLTAERAYVQRSMLGLIFTINVTIGKSAWMLYVLGKISTRVDVNHKICSGECNH